MTATSLRKVGINNRSMNTLIRFSYFHFLFASNGDRSAASLMLRLPVVIFDGFIEPRQFCISDTTVFRCRLHLCVKIMQIGFVFFTGRKHIKSMANALEKVRFDYMHFFLSNFASDKTVLTAVIFISL